ncbi:hypothetical protein [Neokomagataea anthophila]|uniref:DUF945 family protein n=1 Tax=Neokomagataea anthophila TaxID=2826925 RepID=A0ABS5EAK3_9PROT|nr:hypothetical protein [Neokomagataea anthophila]MBR0560543.1 hypothetical protein [Neokomagataea anthophila]
MKRPLLATSLLVAFAGVVAYGTHYGPEHALQNGLTRFRAALPPGSTLEYSAARPDLLARGAHLSDVTLRIHDITYRAHELHLGHVTLSPAGETSFSRLDLEQPSLDGPSYHIHANTMHLRGLVIPPDHGAGLTAVEASNIILDHGETEDLSARFTLRTAQQAWYFTAQNAQLDRYGKNRATTLSLRRTSLDDGTSPAYPTPIFLTCDAFTAQIDDTATTIQETLKNNTPTPPNTASFTALNNTVSFGNNHGYIDQISFHNAPENDGTHSALTATGLHLRLGSQTIPVHLNGAGSTITENTIVSFNHNDLTSQLALTIPDFIHFTFSLHLQKGTIPSAETTPPRSDFFLNNIQFSLQGDRFIHDTPLLLSKTSFSEEDQKSLLLGLQNITKSAPVFAPVLDYITAPNGRTLSLSVVPPTPLPISQIPALAHNPTWGMLLFTPNVMTFSVK